MASLSSGACKKCCIVQGNFTRKLFIEKAEHVKTRNKTTESARPRTNKVGITSEQVHV